MSWFSYVLLPKTPKPRSQFNVKFSRNKNSVSKL